MIQETQNTKEGDVIFIGGGIAEGNVYETWENKICPKCGKRVRESYRAEVIE